MQNTAKYIAIIAVSVAIGVAGAGFSFWLGQRQWTESTKGKVEQSEKQAEEKKQFDPIVVSSIGGKIKLIDKNNLSLDVTGFLGNTKTDIRAVVVNDKTEFSRAYINARPVKAGENNVAPKPEPLNFVDLKIGDRIEVFATEDVKTKKEFLATKIQLLVMLD